MRYLGDSGTHNPPIKATKDIMTPIISKGTQCFDKKLKYRHAKVTD